MIEPSYTDENARAILSIFRDDGVQAGEVLTADALRLAFLRNQTTEPNIMLPV